MAATFGEFFENLRRRIEKNGRTDSQCRDMDSYKSKRRTEPVIHLEKEDAGWKIIAGQELSHLNLLDFSLEMTQAAVRRLAEVVERDNFNPSTYSWPLNSVHEFHHAMLEEARKCGLDADHLTSWDKAKNERKQQKSPPG